MVKKLALALVGVAVLVAAAAPASADSRVYYGSVQETGATAFGNNVYARTYNPGFATVSPGLGACNSSGTIVGRDDATRSCQLKFNSAGLGGYRSHSDDIFNDNGTSGQRRIVVFDAVSGTNASRVGYYFIAGRSVSQTGDPNSAHNTAGCTGSLAQTCVGQGNNSNASGSAIANTPLGTISNGGGFRPIPVPLVTSANRTTGDIVLSWAEASSVNDVLAIAYELVGVAKDAASPPASEAEYTVPLGSFSAPGATVNTSAFGFGPTVPKIYYFAIRLVYPSAGGTRVASRFLSANSAGVTFGGLAATVTNIRAKLVGGQGIAVSWDTSLEDGVKGFYVTRSFTQNGTYERVSGLVAAKGQPSSYTFIDTNVPAGQVRATGVYYKIDTVDVDDQLQSFGPAKADLSAGVGNVLPGKQLRKKVTR